MTIPMVDFTLQLYYWAERQAHFAILNYYDGQELIASTTLSRPEAIQAMRAAEQAWIDFSTRFHAPRRFEDLEIVSGYQEELPF